MESKTNRYQVLGKINQSTNGVIFMLEEILCIADYVMVSTNNYFQTKSINMTDFETILNQTYYRFEI